MALYEEFTVVNVGRKHHEIRTGMTQDKLVYDLMSCDGKKVSFCLIIAGCQGQDHYRKQYETIGPHLFPGTHISCRIAYTHREDGFSMGMSSFAVLSEDHQQITYWIDIPGVIEFYGEAHIPMSCSVKIEHVQNPKDSEAAFVWTNKSPVLSVVHKALRTVFPRRHLLS